MKKWFKNLFLTLVLILSLNSVNVAQSSVAQNSITVSSVDYNKWILSNSSCYGCSSFYLMVVNTTNPSKDGLYYYDVYLWSNSFYANGYAASSYVKNINFFVVDPSGNKKFILKLDYALVPPKSQYFSGSFYLAYIYSISAKQTIKITWSETEIW